MNTKEIAKIIKKNDPVVWKTIGKKMRDSTVLVNELIRHYQWIFQMGDIDNLDLGDRLNKYYKKLFVHALENDPAFRDEFLNYILFAFKIAFDHKTKSWDKSAIVNILVNNKRLFWFDFAAMYALIASSYSEVRVIIDREFHVDPSIGIDKRYFLKLFDGIVNQKFFNEIKLLIKKERLNTNKNIYLVD